MNAARILYPVQVLGPGRRIGIWFCGCPHHCEGCSNPELWQMQPKYEMPPERLANLIDGVCRSNPVDGFTLTGGDPFFQPEALNLLLDRLRIHSQDILVYTGYRMDELENMENRHVREALEKIAVLIDGRYEQARNNGCLLRGSDNQVIHLLSDALRGKYEQYLQTARNQVQNFSIGGSVISVGIHKPGFENEMRKRSRESGLEESADGGLHSEVVS